MPSYVALLRGIMPSDPRMRNENLRRVFEALGFKRVRTVIASGNVLFDSGSRNVMALESRIERAISKELGFSSTTIVRSRAELEALVAREPFRSGSHSAKSYQTVTFLKEPPKKNLKVPFTPENRDYTLVAVHGRDLCAVLDQTSAKTPDLMLWLEKTYGKEITTRTYKTVQRILKAFDDRD